MAKRCGVLLFALFLVCIATMRADASGFALYEFSARGNALGGALVGRADDPSAIAFNPAGITQIPGTAFSLGASFIMPSVDIASKGLTAGSLSNTWIPPHFFYTRQLSDRAWLGLGIMSRFGLGTEFNSEWFGKYNSYYAEIQSISVNPNIAWKLSDTLSVSVGVEAMWFEYESRKKLKTGLGDVDSGLLGDSIAWGWNASIWKQVTENVRLGFSYRSEVEHTIKGHVNFDKPAKLGAYYPNTTAESELTLPEMFFGGIAVQAADNLSIEAGAVKTNWSSYKDLTIRYGQPLNPKDPGSNLRSTPKNYQDVWRYNLGIEWEASPKWTWRLSYVYDESPIPDGTIDYQLPANDRHLYSLGVGYKWDDERSLDLAYTYISIEDRDIPGRPLDCLPDSKLDNGDTHIIAMTYSWWL